VTEVDRENIPLGDIMAMTEHGSIQTAMRYFRTGAIGQTGLAGDWATIPQATEDPPILSDFSVVCSSSTDLGENRSWHKHWPVLWPHECHERLFSC
jgi:hypothetical protein